MFPRLLIFYPYGMFNLLHHSSLARKYKNENVKLYSSDLFFIFYIVATSRSSSSLVFCGKVVLRLALVHSKYTGNGEIVVVRVEFADE